MTSASGDGGVAARTIRVVAAGTVPYGVALSWQNELHRRRVAGTGGDVLLLLEHPHVYTLGRRFSAEHLLTDLDSLRRRGIEVHEADRGGSITYHGPGQLVGYPILALADPAGSPEAGSMRAPDAIAYLRALEEVLIRAVAGFGVAAGRRQGLTGVWVREEKLASIGVNLSRGVTKHGFALNVDADLSFFGGMIPCGIPAVAVTSLERLLGAAPPMAEVREAVVACFADVLGCRPEPGAVEELGLAVPVEEPAAELGLLGVTMRGEATVLPFRRPPAPSRAPRAHGSPASRAHHRSGRNGEGT
jgi:lipoyl(octanoyl) transferase